MLGNYTVSQKTRHPIVTIISSNLNQFSHIFTAVKLLNLLQNGI